VPPGANEKFVKFDPHANHRDPKNYPVLHGVWLYFMIMMSRVFTFFGLHTLCGSSRSTFDRTVRPATTTRSSRRRSAASARWTASTTCSWRSRSSADLHGHSAGLLRPGLVGGSLAGLLGGGEAAGLWHRFFAILLIINFGAALHWARARVHGPDVLVPASGCSVPRSLCPAWKDVKDCLGMLRWFVGLGRGRA
jgi:hypothetical protein